MELHNFKQYRQIRTEVPHCDPENRGNILSTSSDFLESLFYVRSCSLYLEVESSKFVFIYLGPFRFIVPKGLVFPGKCRRAARVGVASVSVDDNCSVSFRYCEVCGFLP